MAQKSVMNSNAVSRDTGSNLIVKIPATFLATTADLQSLDLSHNLIQDLSDCPFESHLGELFKVFGSNLLPKLTKNLGTF